MGREGGMYLKTIPSRSRGGRTFLSVNESYRDPATGRPRSRCVRPLGYLEDLRLEREDPIAWGREVAARMTAERNARLARLTVDLDEKVPEGPGALNLGYAAFEALGRGLGLGKLLEAGKSGPRTGEVLKSLLFGRLLFPGEPAAARFFEGWDFGPGEVREAAESLLPLRGGLLRALGEAAGALSGRDGVRLRCEVGGFRFEAGGPPPAPDGKEGAGQDSGRRGPRERRRALSARMDLVLDGNLLPVTYELHREGPPGRQAPSSELDGPTEDPLQDSEMVVADRRIVSGDEVAAIVARGGGYVFRQAIRRADDRFVNYIMDESGYKAVPGPDGGPALRFKSRLVQREIWLPEEGALAGGRRKTRMLERQIVVWSGSRAARDREERRLASGRTGDLPPANLSDGLYGARRRFLDAEALDGRYIVSTNVAGPAAEAGRPGGGYWFRPSRPVPETEIVQMCEDLGRIEEAFAAPPPGPGPQVWTVEGVRFHFLLSFVSLLMARLMRLRLGRRFSEEEIRDCLRSVQCSPVGGGVYILTHSMTPVLRAVCDTLGLELDRRFMTRREIRGLLASARKAPV